MTTRAASICGIDLGTTNSAVAIVVDGKPVIVADAKGNRTIPSVVSFAADGSVLVGHDARRRLAKDPANTFSSVKRFIGKRFDSKTVKDDAQRVPYEVVAAPDGGVALRCPALGADVTPVDVSGHILATLLATAEDGAGVERGDIKRAVVTVPAYFDDAQCAATIEAGKRAGLEKVKLLHEPVAAALAYGVDVEADETVFVFDLGGGTFDVSLLKIEDGVFTVLSTAGDTHLGGEDFDTALAEDVSSQYKKKSGQDIFTGDDRAQRKLRTACERTKRMLSSSTGANVECFVGEHEINMPYTRARFEKVCEPLFQRCMESVKRVLDDAKMTKAQVDEIVLVGGSTRIPRVQAILSEHFDGKALCKSVHPDEAVAFGAAVQGAILSGARDSATSNLLLVDVIPLSLGIECEGKAFAKVVPRNTPVPCKKKQEFSTVQDYQQEIDVRIFEGERSNTDGNHLLGEFQIEGIERAKAGEPKIDVIFEVNTNGLLTVTARDQVTGAQADVKLQHDRGRLTPEEIDRMCKEAEEMRAEDERAERENLAAMERGDDDM